MPKGTKKAYRTTYVKANILATVICILSPLPLIVSAFLGNEMLMVTMLAVTMAVAGIGASIFTVAGMRMSAINILLREGEYSEGEKKNKKLKETVSSLYWLVTVAIYLLWSFLSGAWHITWLIWVVAGILSSAIDALYNLITAKNNVD